MVLVHVATVIVLKKISASLPYITVVLPQACFASCVSCHVTVLQVWLSSAVWSNRLRGRVYAKLAKELRVGAIIVDYHNSLATAVRTEAKRSHPRA